MTKQRTKIIDSRKYVAEQERAKFARWLLEQSTLTAAGTVVIAPVVVMQLQALADTVDEDTEPLERE